MSRWTWIEDWLLPPAIAVLNSAWLGLWLLWAARALPAANYAAPFAPLLLGLLLVMAALVTRWSLDAAGARLDPRLVLAGLGLLSVFTATWLAYGFHSLSGLASGLLDWGQTTSPSFLGLLAFSFMWWRGIVLGRSHLPHEDAERAFYGGIVALGLLFGVNELHPLIVPAEALLAALAFFATGLGSLALVSLAQARRLEGSEAGHWPSFSRYWLGTVAGVIGFILLAGLVAGGLLSPGAFDRLNLIFQALANVLTVAVLIFFGTLIFLGAWLLRPLLERIALALHQTPIQPVTPPEWKSLADETAAYFQQNPALNAARQTFALLIIAGGLAVLFWLAVRRFSRPVRKDRDETRESIATRDFLLNQLLQLFRRHPKAPPPPAPYLALAGPQDDPRLMVRRAYQSLLEWAPVLSLPPRRAGQTPHAYAELLAQSLPPPGRSALATLTQTYLSARYSADGPSLEEARSALGALSQLQALAAEGPTHSRPPRQAGAAH